MLTIIGTGHVFRIAEPVSFIIKHIWPDAVLVELDAKRFDRMSGKETISEKPRKVPWVYRSTAKYQEKMAGKYKSEVGGELLAAVNTGKLLNSEIIFIDSDAENAMYEAWDEMSFSERSRYTLSMLRDCVLGRKNVDKTQKDFSENERIYMESMRKRYPTLMRKLIDERNEYMAKQIKDAAEKYKNIVVVVGDAHVEGICTILSSAGLTDMNKIRLKDILDPEGQWKLRTDIWNGDNGYDEN